MIIPLNKFGGWLRFFQIINVFIVVRLTVGIFSFNYHNAILFYETGHYWQLIPYLLSVILYCASFFLIFKILKNLGVKSTKSPDLIADYLKYYFITVISIKVLLFIVARSGYFMAEQVINTFIVLGIYSAVWIRYFKKSERVRSFYGVNARQAFDVNVKAEHHSGGMQAADAGTAKVAE